MNHLRGFATAWVLLVEALVTEDLVVVAAGHPTHTRRLAAEVEAGAVAALLIRMSLGVGRHQHGAPRKLLIRTRLTGGERRSVQVPKPQIRMHRRVGEHRAGAHLLGHRTPMLLLRTRVVVAALDQDGGVQRPLGEGRRQNRHPLSRVRPHRLTTDGPVQHHQHREVGASRAG